MKGFNAIHGLQAINKSFVYILQRRKQLKAAIYCPIRVYTKQKYQYWLAIEKTTENCKKRARLIFWRAHALLRTKAFSSSSQLLDCRGKFFSRNFFLKLISSIVAEFHVFKCAVYDLCCRVNLRWCHNEWIVLYNFFECELDQKFYFI